MQGENVYPFRVLFDVKQKYLIHRYNFDRFCKELRTCYFGRFESCNLDVQLYLLYIYS